MNVLLSRIPLLRAPFLGAAEMKAMIPASLLNNDIFKVIGCLKERPLSEDTSCL